MKKYKKLILGFIQVAFAFLIILFTVTGAVDISIGHATPLLLIGMITAFSSFSKALPAAIMGFLAGACLDSVQSGAVCFNTATLMVMATLVWLISNYLFNKNIQSAMVLSLIMSGLYFLLRWAVFFIKPLSVQESMSYLLSYAVPSAIYSAVFIIPFYYFYKFLDKLSKE